jgi:hypothetical protein
MNKCLAGVLVLGPGLALAAQQPLPEWQYSVRPGDTLIGVAAAYMEKPADWQKLQRYNNIADPRRLPPSEKLRIPYAWLRQQPASVDVTSVSGQVELVSAGQADVPLTAGTKLKVGSEIRTAANSSAALVFADGSRMVVQPGTVVRLDTVSIYAGGGMVDTRIRLQRGRTEIFANPLKQKGNRLQVITPSAIAAVRGTVFRVSADAAAAMREETIEGEVGVSAASAEVSVAKAMGTLAEQGQPPIKPVALPLAPELSGLPTRIERYPLSFQLPRQQGVEGWFGQVARDEKFEDILAENEARETKLAFADLPDGRYVLRMRGIDSHGLHGLDGLHHFEVDAHPLPPRVDVYEQLKEIFSLNVRLRLTWRASEEAEKYRIQLSTDKAFRQGVAEYLVAATHLDLEADQYKGEHYWRVASIANTGEQGPFSALRQFEYHPTPTAPGIEASKIEIDAKELRIALPKLPDGQHYLVTLAKGKEIKEIVWRGELQGLLFSVPKPEPGPYFFAAQAVNEERTAGSVALFPLEIGK